MKLSYKLLGWHILIALLSWQFWSYGKYVSTTPEGLDFEGTAFITLIILAALLAMGFFLFGKREWALSGSGVVGLIYLLTFGFSWLSIVGVAIVLGLSLLSWKNSTNELKQRVSIHPRRVLQSGLLPLFLGLFILVSFAAYQSPKVNEFKNIEELPPATQKILKTVIAETAGDKIEASSEQEKQTILDQVSTQIIRDINSMIRPVAQYAPPILAFAIFLILLGLMWIFLWLSVLAGLVLYFILRISGFFRIETVETKKEIITL